MEVQEELKVHDANESQRHNKMLWRLVEIFVGFFLVGLAVYHYTLSPDKATYNGIEKSIDFFWTSIGSNVLSAFVVYITLKYFVPSQDKLPSLLNLLHQKLNVTTSYVQNLEAKILNSVNGVHSHLVLTNEVQGHDSMVHKLRSIANSERKAYSNLVSLRPVLETITTDYVSEMEEIAEGKVTFRNEANRIRLIKNVFDNITAIDNIRDILAVTWDHQGYFDRFWAKEPLGDYISRNKEAASKNIKIYRLFVLDKNDVHEKVERLQEIHDATKHVANISTRWLFEQDIPLPSDNIKSWQTSFLLIGNKQQKRYKVVSQTASPRNDYYMKLSEGETETSLTNTFNFLWERAKPFTELSTSLTLIG